MKKFKAYRDSKMSKLDAKEADRAKYREEELKRMYWVCVMKGKIIVTFFQIVCSFGGIFTVPYPEVFTKFLGYFNILNLGILNFFSTGCLLERDYYNDLAVVTLRCSAWRSCSLTSQRCCFCFLLLPSRIQC